MTCTIVPFTLGRLSGNFAHPCIHRVSICGSYRKGTPGMRVRSSATAFAFVVIACLTARSAAAADPASMFTRKCSSCHTFGRGVLVGPDLKGATNRHTREWLVAWISSSENLIRAGDPAAIALFNRFKPQRMPDQTFTPTELSALLDYLAAGGPEADARRNDRRADTATDAEIEMGR